MRRSVAITGASGYVGGAIARVMRHAGWDVIGLQRSGTGPDVRRFKLGDPVDPASLAGISALVHCAYDFDATTWTDIHRSNVEGTRQLFAAARDAGVSRLVFISSMSAFPSCRSMYGRAKLEAESAVAPLGANVVRPGLVYGPEAKGMVGALGKLLGIPLVTPLVGSGAQILYLAHEDDLGRMVAELCATPSNDHAPLVAASARPFRFKEILALLARRDGKKRVMLPVPWQLEWLALKTAEAVGLRMRLRSDSLVSLMNQDPSPNFEPSARFAFRDFEDFVGNSANA